MCNLHSSRRSHKKSLYLTISDRGAWRGTTPVYLSAARHRKGGNKKPLSTMGQGRNRGTTLHYTLKACPVTGTSVLIYGNSFNQEAHE